MKYSITTCRNHSKEAEEFSELYQNLDNVYYWEVIDKMFFEFFGEECIDQEIEDLYDSVPPQERKELNEVMQGFTSTIMAV